MLWHVRGFYGILKPNTTGELFMQTASRSRMCAEENCGTYDDMLIKTGHWPSGMANIEQKGQQCTNCHIVSHLKAANY